MTIRKTLLTAAILAATCLSSSAQGFRMPKIEASVIKPQAVTSQTGVLTHPWTGKTVFFIGDSISDCNLPAAMGREDSVKRYFVYLSEWLGITPVVTAISGLEWNSVERQVEMYKEAVGETVPDAICILLGTNDYNMGVPIGEWYKEIEAEAEVGNIVPRHMEKRIKRVPEYDGKTLKGRINIAMKLLKETFPTTPIVILTPLHRSTFDFADNNLQPDEFFQNGIGLYLDEYINAIKETSTVWSVSVVDLAAHVNMFPSLDSQALFYTDPAKDRLHPGALGHKRMAEVIMYQTLGIPARTTE